MFSRHSRKQKGFTLLEMMLVILLCGSITLAIKSVASEDPLQEESLRLTEILHWAEQQAQRDGHIYGLAPSQNAWQLMVLKRKPNGSHASYYWPGYYWHPVDKTNPLHHSLPESISVQLTKADALIPLPASLEDSMLQEPKLLLFPGGEHSEAEITLIRKDGSQQLVWPALADNVR
ncbi:prepilin-type N-terminal cleavage/methylation domain-containing protein [Enterobacter ludwigii]|jgi:general secretion pathway protein H